MELSPRLRLILLLILNAEAPIPAEDLATHLSISKRTVFRELDGVDKNVARYSLTLDTKSKKGFLYQAHRLTNMRFLKL